MPFSSNFSLACACLIVILRCLLSASSQSSATLPPEIKIRKMLAAIGFLGNAPLSGLSGA